MGRGNTSSTMTTERTHDPRNPRNARTADPSFDAIKQSHALSGDAGRLDDFYRNWADSYDADVYNQGYQGPQFITELAVDAAHALESPPSTLSVLDAGCGTGLVGVELARRGFSRIDGIDLSQAMVDRARDTGSYERLIGGVDLNCPVDCVPADAYDLLVCCGVFTVGHVEAEALDHLLDTVRPGGVLVISTRHSYLRGSRFTEHVAGTAEDGQITLVASDDNGPYIDEEGATYWVLRKDG
ncbi:class I SAM-dependent DNA methyltransferase [Streptomyces monticola]|uniref:Class I SAM-dependent DNA methyltransferase n=1 Tax=Streptomyces monticola TaxID=2666263 RepID=A0ABW2JQF0_9ACTN